MQEPSTRPLTLSYVVALTLIASLSLAANLTFGRVLKQHQGSAALLNISGRQGMLTQRIASLSTQLSLGDTTVRPDLVSAIDQLERAAQDLLAGDGKNLPPLSPNVKSVYLQGLHPLYQQELDYIQHARRLVALAPGDPAFAGELQPLLEAARKPLFTGFDVVVGLHELDSENRLAYLQWIETATLAATLATLAVEALLIFRPMVRRIKRYAQSLWLQATTDSLTGLFNRRSFMTRGASQLAQNQLQGLPLALLMLDADHFKDVNDRYGHQAGDAVLQALARVLQNNVRKSDLLGRLGGEEFAVLLPGVASEAASAMARRLLRAIEDELVSIEGQAIRFTISIGLAARSERIATLDALLRAADDAMYRAKAAGRNRLELAFVGDVPVPV